MNIKNMTAGLRVLKRLDQALNDKIAELAIIASASIEEEFNEDYKDELYLLQGIRSLLIELKKSEGVTDEDIKYSDDADYWHLSAIKDDILDKIYRLKQHFGV